MKLKNVSVSIVPAGVDQMKVWNCSFTMDRGVTAAERSQIERLLEKALSKIDVDLLTGEVTLDGGAEHGRDR